MTTDTADTTKVASIIINLDKVRQGDVLEAEELLHTTQMKTLQDKIYQMKDFIADFKLSLKDDRDSSRISHKRHHDAILLSGGRGTGKTTFLLSVLHKLQKEKWEERSPFCVFEPIDPTLFGYNEHILLTLLSMIAEKVRAARKQDDLGSFHSGDKWDAWENQLKELAKGLKTVGEQREDIDSTPSSKTDSWDDPEYLLEEGMASVRSSYELERKFHLFVNDSLELLKKEAFLLGLDDVDTRPGIGWHVLETLRRYLTTPQIIIIVSGNIDLFQKLVERQQLKNLGLNFSSQTGILEKFTPQVVEMTNQYLLKILRLPMRIELWSFYETLKRIGKSDDKYVIKCNRDDIKLSKILDVFYEGLACSTSDGMKDLFRKALFSNPARTVLQVLEHLIEDKNIEDKNKKASQNIRRLRHRRVAESLRMAFYDHLLAAGLPQPQEYFEHLREGLGLEEITRLLLEGKLPGDASLRPDSNELKDNNTLLTLTGEITAAIAENSTVFFMYFFKICLALHVFEGKNNNYLDTVFSEGFLRFVFHCSSSLYNEGKHTWKAPGILSLPKASSGKHTSQLVKTVYGTGPDFANPLNIVWSEELRPFIDAVCPDNNRPLKQLRGYIITTIESLQDDILSWHKCLLLHTFYDEVSSNGTNRFFSIWALLGLMTELLACETKEKIFDILFRKARITTLHIENTNVDSTTQDDDERDAKETPDSEDEQYREQQDDFVQAISLWKKRYTSQSNMFFTPTSLCVRVFSRFLHGMERLNNTSNNEIFLGKYIHRSLVIFFNSLLVEEYIACNKGMTKGLNLTTPLSSDDIFLKNVTHAFDTKDINAISFENTIKKYPLTSLVLSCPLWFFYIKPKDDKKNTDNTVIGIVEKFIAYTIKETKSALGDKYNLENSIRTKIFYSKERPENSSPAAFNNLYYILNSLAISRNLHLQKKSQIHSPTEEKTREAKNEVSKYGDA